MSTIDRILTLVKESGATAKEFAEGAGIAGGSITDWKTGRSKPSVESLQKIAKYANVKLEWLTGDSEFKNHEDALKQYVEEQIAITVLKCFAQYHSEYVVPCDINKDKTDELIDLLKSIQYNYSANESKKQLKKFIDSFPSDKQKKIMEFLRIILKDIVYVIDSFNIAHNLMSLIEMEKDNNNNLTSSIYNCPVYGQISAGQPNWVEECLEGYLPIDPNLMNINNPEECFFLRVNGESMNTLVKNGAYALIRKQDTVENGEVAVVLVNGDEATLKKFTQHNDVIVLEPMSSDPSFTTQIYDKNTKIKILGKYIGKFELN